MLSDYLLVLCLSFLGHFLVISGNFLVILASNLEASGAPVAKWLLLGSQRGRSQKESPTHILTSKMKLCARITQQNHRSVVQKHSFTKKDDVMEKGRPEASRGMLFEGLLELLGKQIVEN